MNKAPNLTRAQQIQQIIDRGDLEELQELAEPSPCACSGSVDNEPKCRCAMTMQQLQSQISLAGLKRGKVVRLHK